MSDRAIRDAINQITGTHQSDKVYSVSAVVVSVNKVSRTCVCQVVNGKANNTLPNVKLMASIDDGFLIIPEIDSNVNIILSDFTPAYISQYSGIDEIIFRGGDLGGMVKVKELTSKLNQLVTSLNVELVKIQTGIIAGGGAYTPTTQKSFSQTDYENKAVSHG